jgi:NAD(P)-dependent dehydrogenase (short-subunit alcohol dehydrogenase family)
MSELFDIAGKTVLVTGGASGIGLMASQAFARAGCKVLIASRKGAVCESAAAAINEELGRDCAFGFAADLASDEGIAAIVQTLSEHTEKLDILMNNAGATWGAPMGEFPRSGFDKIMNVNVTGVFMLTQALLPMLEAAASAADPARIVNVGSVVGHRAVGNNAYSYTASKAAVHHLTKVLSNELAARHITVNAIAPGPFPSRMMAFVTENEELAALARADVPLGRLGEPDDVAGVLQFLCSRAGAYINGAIIPLDGGMSAKP